MSVKFFLDRKPHPKSTLEKIQCPVKLIHFLGDIAYPVEYTQELMARMEDACVSVSLDSIDGACHYGSVTNPQE